MSGSKFLFDETIVAPITPPGEGAIAVLRLSGPEAVVIADRLFRGKILQQQKSHTIHFGTIRKGDDIIDEVVVSLYKAPHSYTKEDVVEISCHGSPYIRQQLLQLFIKEGARMAKPGEFTQRAFLNGRMDLAQAEAVADLIASRSAVAHKTALHQMKGGVSGEIKLLREQLIHFASMIELELDFSEEDVKFADRKELVELVDRIKVLLNNLVQSFELGNAIKNGITTVIAGRPNAGKSTLLNALVNEERAIVSDIPGTTRDTIEEVINIDGFLFRFIDTAGIRDASDKIEAIGVEKTMNTIRKSAIIVYLFDVNEMEPEELKNDIEKLNAGKIPLILVGNKADKAGSDPEKKFGNFKDVVFISSLKKENIDQLIDRLTAYVEAKKAEGEDAVITNARHYSALQQASDALQQVTEGIDNGISGDLLSLDIRHALDHLGEVTGETITSDDLLGNIFSKFCIGK